MQIQSLYNLFQSAVFGENHPFLHLFATAPVCLRGDGSASLRDMHFPGIIIEEEAGKLSKYDAGRGKANAGTKRF